MMPTASTGLSDLRLLYTDGLMLYGSNSIADPLDLPQSCTKPLLLFKFTSSACINGLMQKRRNSSANALELHLFSIEPSIWHNIC